MKLDKKDQASQIDRFRDLARELGCDESEERFNAALKNVGQTTPSSPPTSTSTKRHKKPENPENA